ncbi:MAG: hypothetical protein HDR88_07750 [Bacteroides sp.]|nr:hypothetical protein [Bacteroides sp.]
MIRVRERKPQFIGFSESLDCAMNFSKGDTLTMSAMEVKFPAHGVTDLKPAGMKLMGH